MKSNFEKALASVLHHEGGFVNNPKDPGGVTNLGCTQRVWEEYVGHPVTEQAMRDLKPEDVAPLYKKKYWDKVAGDDLPAGVDYCVFDTAINSGPGRAVKMLQACVGVEVDGALGPTSLKAVNAFGATNLISDYCQRRLSFLTELAAWETFGKGWTRRVNEVKDAATKMVSP